MGHSRVSRKTRRVSYRPERERYCSKNDESHMIDVRTTNIWPSHLWFFQFDISEREWNKIYLCCRKICLDEFQLTHEENWVYLRKKTSWAGRTFAEGLTLAFIATWWNARATRSLKSVAEYPSVWLDNSVKFRRESLFWVMSFATSSRSWTSLDSILKKICE